MANNFYKNCFLYHQLKHEKNGGILLKNVSIEFKMLQNGYKPKQLIFGSFYWNKKSLHVIIFV